DADLARVARGVAVSQKTEDAMTQVLAGAGAATAATMITRPRAVTAPPVYRPPNAYYEETPGRRSVWPWLLGILACAIAAIGGYLIYQRIEQQLSTAKPIAVVDVRSIDKALAVRKLEEQGFDVKAEQQSSDTVPAGKVVDQDPSPGSRIARGSKVTVTVSKGPATSQVPNVTSRQQSEAVSLLQQAGFLVTIVKQDVTDPSQDGLVLAESPHGGQKARQGASVTITVGRLVQQPTT